MVDVAIAHDDVVHRPPGEDAPTRVEGLLGPAMFVGPLIAKPFVGAMDLQAIDDDVAEPSAAIVKCSRRRLSCSEVSFSTPFDLPDPMFCLTASRRARVSNATSCSVNGDVMDN